MGVLGSLWRTVTVLRVASLLWAAVLMLLNHDNYANEWAGLAVLVAMVVWTGVATAAYASGRYRNLVLVVDLAGATLLLLATALVETRERISAGVPTVTVTWSAVPVVAWAICRGRRGGLFAAAVVGVANIALHGYVNQGTFSSLVLLLLLGGVGGYLVRVAVDAEARLAEAVQLEAATRERERLARQIHDGVLQTLSLIHRRGRELGGDASALAELAADQEGELRGLVARQSPVAPAGTADVRDVVRRLAAESPVRVDVAAPAEPVLLPAAVSEELCAAVAQALDNVARHAGPGAQAWVFVDDEGDAVTVSVRDDGAGFAPGRLEAAERDGRLGVAQSIRGRVRDLGGTVSIEATPGSGVEVEFRVPRLPVASR